MKVFEKFQLGLKKTSSYISSSMMGILSSNKIDKEVIDDLESILINSDQSIDKNIQLSLIGLPYEQLNSIRDEFKCRGI